MVLINTPSQLKKSFEKSLEESEEILFDYEC
jgi:hypothetical protein